MIDTRVLPELWNLTLIKGDRVPPLSFKAVDYDGNDYSDYVPRAKVHKKLSSAAVKTLTVSDGLSKTDAATTMDLFTTLPKYNYDWYIQLTLTNGWIFTVAAGKQNVILPGEMTGANVNLMQKVFRLPIRVVEGGGIQLLDENGDPILAEDGSFITQE